MVLGLLDPQVITGYNCLYSLTGLPVGRWKLKTPHPPPLPHESHVVDGIQFSWNLLLPPLPQEPHVVDGFLGIASSLPYPTSHMFRHW